MIWCYVSGAFTSHPSLASLFAFVVHVTRKATLSRYEAAAVCDLKYIPRYVLPYSPLAISSYDDCTLRTRNRKVSRHLNCITGLQHCQPVNMPRTLPWLAQAKKQDAATTSSSSPAPTSRRKREATPSSDHDLVDPDLNPVGVSTPARRAKSLRPARSPSTSPPPALHAPPPVEYMHEGFTADDAWMMVEDEFLATAQLYTQHLHHAAYAEAKRRAKARGERTLRNLGRATDGVTEQSRRTMLELEADALGKREEAADGEEDDGMEWEVDPQLAGLMNRVDRVGRELKGLGKVRSHTRAAKGFLRSPEKARKTTMLNDGDLPFGEDEEDYSDDLDGPAPRQSKAVTSKLPKEPRHPVPAPLTKEQERKADKRKSTGIFKRFAAAKDESASSASASKRKDNPASPDKKESLATKRSKLDSGSRISASTPAYDFAKPKKSDKERENEEFLARRAARRAKRAQEESKAAEEERKKVFDDLPTFMI